MASIAKAFNIQALMPHTEANPSFPGSNHQDGTITSEAEPVDLQSTPPALPSARLKIPRRSLKKSSSLITRVASLGNSIRSLVGKKSTSAKYSMTGHTGSLVYMSPEVRSAVSVLAGFHFCRFASLFWARSLLLAMYSTVGRVALRLCG